MSDLHPLRYHAYLGLHVGRRVDPNRSSVRRLGRKYQLLGTYASMQVVHRRVDETGGVVDGPHAAVRARSANEKPPPRLILSS